MTSEEMVTEINHKNKDLLYKQDWPLSSEQVLKLMNQAGINGFRQGSNTALSMVQGALYVTLAKAK